jgi:hypothetical protein
MPEEPRKRRDIVLIWIGVISFVVGLTLLDNNDRTGKWWGSILVQVGTIALAAGLAAWAVIGCFTENEQRSRRQPQRATPELPVEEIKADQVIKR